MAIEKTGILVDTSSSFNNPLVYETRGAARTITADNLNPNTTYYTKAYVVKEGITVYSNNTASFTTAAANLDYLTFTNLDQTDATLRFMKDGNPYDIILEYSIDDGVTWTRFSTADWDPVDKRQDFTIPVGKNIKFRGDNATFSTSSTECYTFSATFGQSNISVSGNVMSLVDSSCQSIEIPCDYCFSRLFSDGSGNYHVYSLYVDDVRLPATKLTKYCYMSMFYGDENTVTPPELPATELTDGCYSNMFLNSGLTSAPRLPSTQLASNCYYRMFEGTQITECPELPATDLKNECYYSMFNSTPITTPPVLPATVMKYGCYKYMLAHTNIVTPPALPATTLASECYYGLFYDCADLTECPELPATTVYEGSYQMMFREATSITDMPVMYATTISNSSYRDMFRGATNLVNTTPFIATRNAGSLSANYAFDGTFRDCPNIKEVEVHFPDCESYILDYMCDGCSSLEKVKVYLTSWYSNCATNWLRGTAATGTIHLSQQLTVGSGQYAIPLNSNSGIPVGWSYVQDLP